MSYVPMGIFPCRSNRGLPRYLHSETQADDLAFFMLFSSVSATVGLAGGSSYSAANAYLDGLANWRKQRLSAMSVKWGPVSEVGMTAASGQADHLEAMALKTMSVAQVSSALRYLLSQQGPSANLRGEVMLARVDWAAFVREVGMDIPQIKDFQPKTGGKKAGGAGKNNALAAMSEEDRMATVLKSIRGAAEGMGLEMEAETPFMEAGIDSLSAVEFRNKVSSEFREVRLPSTLMFDYPSMSALAAYVSGQIVPVEEVASAEPQVKALAARSSAGAKGGDSAHLAILGGACHLPGDSWSLEHFGYMLSQAVDCVVEVPYNRWDQGEYYDPDASTGLKMYMKHAGFIEGIELFAASNFSITKPEAETMDPQQRHLLETAFESFVGAGYSRNQLMGSLTGVFIGQDKCDWNRMTVGGGPFAATGGSSSISANRISYALGLKGPSATMDTACSSSLVAADTAAATLRRRRCELAVVAGVNMCLLPETFVACCQAHMLSAGGRCRTFDETASGYSRGEGCGAQTFQLLSDKPAYAELRGSALNQDGRSSNLTSPNGPSQTAVVLSALSEAGIAPHMLDCLETHGTGTALGDPIEIGALSAALGGARREKPLLLGAAKSNIGHLEGGAGIVGLTKLVALVRTRNMPSNVHLRELNDHIAEDLEDFAASFPTENTKLAAKDYYYYYYYYYHYYYYYYHHYCCYPIYQKKLDL